MSNHSSTPVVATSAFILFVVFLQLDLTGQGVGASGGCGEAPPEVLGKEEAAIAYSRKLKSRERNIAVPVMFMRSYPVKDSYGSHMGLSIGYCTGTRISYSVVLTAAHCFHAGEERGETRRYFVGASYPKFQKKRVAMARVRDEIGELEPELYHDKGVALIEQAVADGVLLEVDHSHVHVNDTWIKNESLRQSLLASKQSLDLIYSKSRGADVAMLVIAKPHLLTQRVMKLGSRNVLRKNGELIVFGAGMDNCIDKRTSALHKNGFRIEHLHVPFPAADTLNAYQPSQVTHSLGKATYRKVINKDVHFSKSPAALFHARRKLAEDWTGDEHIDGLRKNFSAVCPGDSGSGVFVFDKKKKEYQLVSVLSALWPGARSFLNKEVIPQKLKDAFQEVLATGKKFKALSQKERNSVYRYIFAGYFEYLHSYAIWGYETCGMLEYFVYDGELVKEKPASLDEVCKEALQ